MRVRAGITVSQGPRTCVVVCVREGESARARARVSERARERARESERVRERESERARETLNAEPDIAVVLIHWGQVCRGHSHHRDRHAADRPGVYLHLCRGY